MLEMASLLQSCQMEGRGHVIGQLEGEARQQQGHGGHQADLGQGLAHAIARALRKGDVALRLPSLTCTAATDWQLETAAQYYKVTTQGCGSMQHTKKVLTVSCVIFTANELTHQARAACDTSPALFHTVRPCEICGNARPGDCARGRGQQLQSCTATSM